MSYLAFKICEEGLGGVDVAVEGDSSGKDPTSPSDVFPLREVADGGDSSGKDPPSHSASFR
jgi:hypothetical protein